MTAWHAEHARAYVLLILSAKVISITSTPTLALIAVAAHRFARVVLSLRVNRLSGKDKSGSSKGRAAIFFKTNFTHSIMKVKIINESSNPLPEYATPGSAGMDLRASLPEGSVTLAPLQRVIVPTGIRLEIPQGFECQIRPRSGLAAKHGVTVLNSPGTIDSDYRGYIGVILVNLSSEPFVIENGERICQMVFAKVETATLVQTDSISDTDRGDGGFGHTGVK